MSRLRFSLSELMLAVLAIAIGCAAVRWLGSVWLIPLALAGLGTASLALAIRRARSWRMLALSCWHLVIWLALGAAASGLAVRCCLQYNEVAGTDKTPQHILRISAAVLTGPMVGPVANPGAGETPAAWRWTAILFTALFLAAGPFLFVRRIVSVVVALVSWIGFVAASVLWYFGAMFSLGMFLS
jgi:hypothetical protein